MKRFGEKLRILRKRRGFSLRDLDKEIANVSFGHLGNLEKGRKNPSVDLVLTLCEFFEVTPNHLLLDDWDVDRVISDEGG